MSRRTVLGITGIRSEYFLQRPIFHAIARHPDLDLKLVVAGAHLSVLRGHSVDDVERDGFSIVARISNLIESDHDADRLKGAADQLRELTGVVEAIRPDWLIAPGDREEAMTLALCGAYQQIPTVHYGAGDRVVGNVDDMVRHAISRLAHLLLTTNEDARQRLIRAGEQDWRVHNVGHSGLDRIRVAAELTREQLAGALGVSAIADRYAIVVQHPLSSEIALAGAQMRETMAAAVDLGLQTFVSYPNSDPGSHEIIRVIEEHRSTPRFHIFRNIPDEAFVNLLRGAAVLIGNSSLGLLEAPFLKLPVVNVGHRQTARHHSDNVFFVSADRQAIVAQAQAILHDEATRQLVRAAANPFGDGFTGERIADLLARTPIDGVLLNKDLVY
jgi:GDP/UDP-N,N'-diacetylbacillosamine 2-epimerase (hydrolysing)